MVFCLPWRLQSDLNGFREGKPRTEVILNDGRQRKPFMQRLNEKRLKRCFFVLNIRQGTILIALLELIVWLFFCMMVIMVLLHVLQIEALIISEVEDSPARESIALSGLSGQEAVIAEVNNESRLQVGLHHAEYRVLGIIFLLMVIVLHIVASGFLLLGAVWRKRGMLIMWLSTSTTDLSLTVCAMIVAVTEFIFKGERFVGSVIEVEIFVLISFASIGVLTHNLLIAGSLYWDLSEERKRGRSTTVARNIHINSHLESLKEPLFKALYIRPYWNTDVDRDVQMLGDSGTADANPTAERNDDVIPNKPLIPDLLSDPLSELAVPLQPELKLA